MSQTLGLWMLVLLLSSSRYALGRSYCRPTFLSVTYGGRRYGGRRVLSRDATTKGNDTSISDVLSESATSSSDMSDTVTPWNHPRLYERKKSKRNNKTRFRQHVNPLASRYQKPTVLSETWPTDIFREWSKPLHLDIGSGKGGFLLDMALADDSYNYLGLEIRPLVAQFARERVSERGLTGKVDFLGCNANVDLSRILERCRACGCVLSRVSIQFPDPHFKSHHAKRRVVNEKLVNTLAQYLVPHTGLVFLQSDVQSVLDNMRGRFAESSYFEDHCAGEYLEENILGVPTEREVSVLEKGSPVYRALFYRIEEDYDKGRASTGTAGMP